MRVAGRFLAPILLLLCCCSTATVKNPAPAPGNGMYACVFSSVSLNKFFEKKGYGKNYFRVIRSVWIDAQRNRLFITRHFNETTYVISADENITEIENPEKNFTLLGLDSRPEVVFERGKLKIRGAGEVRELPGEYIPIEDLSYRYYARRFRDEVGINDRFAVYSNGSSFELFRDIGEAIQLQSMGDTIHVVSWHPHYKEFRLSEFERKDKWQLVSTLSVPKPTEVRSDWYTNFRDLDVEHSLVLFTEERSFRAFYDPSAYLYIGSPKLWVYDVKAHGYQLAENLPRGEEELYAFFLPAPFASASYVIWSKRVAD